MAELEAHCEFDLIIGDGLVTDQPTMLHGILFTPISGNDYVTIYNGRDATSGIKIGKIITAYVMTRYHTFGHPVYCPQGIYVEGSDDEVETTILHREVGR